MVEKWQLVQRIELLGVDGSLSWFDAVSFKLALCRRNARAAFWALLALTSSSTDQLQHIRDVLQRRNAAQPIGSFNCGSVFRNPIAIMHD